MANILCIIISSIFCIMKTKLIIFINHSWVVTQWQWLLYM